MGTTAYIAMLTVLAYALFFAYDAVSVRSPKASRGYALFILGFLINTAAVAVLLISQIPVCLWDVVAYVAFACAAVCMVLMIWALFFALPKDTYSDPQLGRPVCSYGMYALCRHPGVLWYCGVFLFAAVTFRTADATVACVILCAGNIAYMVFQDLWSFPRIFCDYEEYRASVPFFFPTPTSFRRAFTGWQMGGERS